MFLLCHIASAVPAQAQNIVKGRVTNETGQGIPNASITVKGSSAGVSSSSTGTFEIATPPNATLVISSVGFAAKEVVLTGSRPLTWPWVHQAVTWTR
jgi:hypothetical protein